MTSPRTRWLVWIIYTLVWTLVLVFPMPEELDRTAEELLLGRKFLVAKGLHILAYVGLTVLSGWLRVAPKYRVALIAFLMVHATITELIQLGVSRRSGTLPDVAFDHLGILVGLAVSWKWWQEET